MPLLCQDTLFSASLISFVSSYYCFCPNCDFMHIVSRHPYLCLYPLSEIWCWTLKYFLKVWDFLASVLLGSSKPFLHCRSFWSMNRQARLMRKVFLLLRWLLQIKYVVLLKFFLSPWVEKCICYCGKCNSFIHCCYHYLYYRENHDVRKQFIW